MTKKLIISFVVVFVVAVIFVLIIKKPEKIEVINNDVVNENKLVELCFGMFTPANERGFSDKYTLQMLLDNQNGKVSGELKFLPGEKDSKVGKFEGTVSVVDKVMMARTINATWHTFGEGINADEMLKIIFGEGTANIEGFGLVLNDIDCRDLTMRDNIEKYVRANISTLSPVKAVLGGTWYVIGVSTDLSKNSGTVVYEDGHIQEKKNFTFNLNTDGSVSNVIIK